MEVFVARQPILNEHQEIVAYEILYRLDENNAFPQMDGDQATSDVMNNMAQLGFNEISYGKPCIINFTETLLMIDIPAYFHPRMVVIEILETVKFIAELINTCQRLKSQGYKIALDDFVLPKNDDPNVYKMLEIVDLVKVDFRAITQENQLAMLRVLKKYNIQLVAEKVETDEEYELCKRDGSKLFQGFYFSKPAVISAHNYSYTKSANF